MHWTKRMEEGTEQLTFGWIDIIGHPDCKGVEKVMVVNSKKHRTTTKAAGIIAIYGERDDVNEIIDQVEAVVQDRWPGNVLIQKDG